MFWPKIYQSDQFRPCSCFYLICQLSCSNKHNFFISQFLSFMFRKPIFQAAFFPVNLWTLFTGKNPPTGNITKDFKVINKFEWFCSFCTWKVLLTMKFQQIGKFRCIFSCLLGQTSKKCHYFVILNNLTQHFRAWHSSVPAC